MALATGGNKLVFQPWVKNPARPTYRLQAISLLPTALLTGCTMSQQPQRRPLRSQ